jgi:hypothetical protein
MPTKEFHIYDWQNMRDYSEWEHKNLTLIAKTLTQKATKEPKCDLLV